MSVKAKVLDQNSVVRASISQGLGGEPYEGVYLVTPSPAAQTLPTSGRRLDADIVVEAIPNNYGLVTWNGAYLMIS